MGRIDGEAKSLRVILGAFDPIVTHGLGSVLRADASFKIVATGLDADALEKAAAALSTSVVLVSDVLGSVAIERLRMAVPRAGIVVFVTDPTLAYGRLLLDSGVSCVAWSVSPVELLATVQRVGTGNRVFTASDGCSIEWRESDPKLLSRRELQVLRYLSQGLTHAKIAAELGMALRTVGTHATRIYQKLEVGGRREAAGLFSTGWFGEN
jgi:DNA-binding NarL/FixJ family response regulator